VLAKVSTCDIDVENKLKAETCKTPLLMEPQ